MTKKLTTLILILLLTGGFLGSCTTELDTGGNSDSLREITLTLDESLLRGTGESIGSNINVSWLTGDLYFVNSNNVIVNHFSIVDGANSGTTATNLASGIINRSDLNRSISGINGSAQRVVIVGNTSGNPTTGMIRPVLERRIDVLAQADRGDSSGPMVRVNVYDGRDISNANTVTLRPAPTVARIEIPNVTGTGKVESFTVEGVFVNNYHRYAQVNGVIPTGVTNPLVNNAATPSSFILGSGAYPLSPNHYPALVSWHTPFGDNPDGYHPAPLHTSPVGLPVVSPANNAAGAPQVWSFQLFAASGGTEFPDIVIRLNNIELKDGTKLSGHRLITVSSAKFAAADTDDGKMHPGRVYRIPAGIVAFDEKDFESVEINGVRWATRNVAEPHTFADNPWDPGRLYQWGMRDGEHRHWHATIPGEPTGLPGSGSPDGWNTIMNAEWTAVNDPCPIGWRLPTGNELFLLAGAGHTPESNWNNTGVNGILFGTEPNQIFLPAVGFRNGAPGPNGDLTHPNRPYYWSSTLLIGEQARYLDLSGTGEISILATFRRDALAIRCVAI